MRLFHLPKKDIADVVYHILINERISSENSINLDQLSSSEANWKDLHVFSLTIISFAI